MNKIGDFGNRLKAWGNGEFYLKEPHLTLIFIGETDERGDICER